MYPQSETSATWLTKKIKCEISHCDQCLLKIDFNLPHLQAYYLIVPLFIVILCASGNREIFMCIIVGRWGNKVFKAVVEGSTL